LPEEAAEFHRFLRGLCERLNWVDSALRRSIEPTSPIVVLRPEPGDDALALRLTHAFKHVWPRALLAGRTPDDDHRRSELPWLSLAVAELHSSDTSLRFTRYGLLDRLTKKDPSDGKQERELPGDELMWRLGRKRAAKPGDPVNTLASSQTLYQFVFAVVAVFLPVLRFWFWLLGAPGLGQETRWIRRQKFLRPDQTAGFKEFALSLGKARSGENSSDDIRQLHLLLTHAFLEDLRVAYRRVLWRPSTWRRSCRPILLLQDDLAVCDLIADVRAETNEPDPLVLIVAQTIGPPAEPPALPPEVPVTHAALRSWSLPTGSGTERADWYLVCRVGGTASAALAASVPIPRPVEPVVRLYSTAWVIAVALLVTSGTTGYFWHEGYFQQTPAHTVAASLPCPAGHKTDSPDTWALAWTPPDGSQAQCVGISDSNSLVFQNPMLEQASDTPGSPDNGRNLQNLRIKHDQEAIFDENSRAEQLHQGSPDKYPLFGLAYFAGLTSGPGDDYDSGEAEELEGLLEVQRQKNYGDSGPLLKIAIVNGGSKMGATTMVLQPLIEMFARDKSLLAVVGMDRSIKKTLRAIGELDAKRIPILATTLSGDGIDADEHKVKYHYYFPLSPDNHAEAKIILRYLRDVVPQYFSRPYWFYPSGGQTHPSKVWIYRPSPKGSLSGQTADPKDDIYTWTLVEDLRKEAKDLNGRRPAPVIPAPDVTDELSPKLCGASSAVIYAGRHDAPPAPGANDNFTKLLDLLANQCHGQVPFVIADDGVSRFVADPVRRGSPIYHGLHISYVTKGINVLHTGRACTKEKTAGDGSPFCAGYAKIATELKALQIGTSHVELSWTGERVGLTYDAANLIFDAIEDHGAALPTRDDIPGLLEAKPHDGINGTFHYKTANHIPDDRSDRPLAVVRLILGSGSAMPICEYPGRNGSLLGNGSPTQRCPEPAQNVH
jgi:hypothetical protein